MGQWAKFDRIRTDNICFSTAFKCQGFTPYPGPANQPWGKFPSKAKVHPVFIVVPQRIPLVEKNEKGDWRLVGFKFTQHVRIVDIVAEKTKVYPSDLKYYSNKKLDHDQFKCFLPNHILHHVPAEKR